MITTEIKQKLIEKITQTEDISLLEEIYSIMLLEEPEAVYNLTPDQKKLIEQSRSEIKDNKFYTNEDADKNIDEWLNQ